MTPPGKDSGAESPQLYDILHVASSFREIAVDVIRGETTEFISRWYQSSSGEADLSVWWDGDHRVVKQQLCLYGQVVEWNPIYGTRTGMVVESEGAAVSEPKDISSEIIHYDQKPQATAIEQALSLLALMTVLVEADRSLFAHNFRESPKLHHRARERALKAWAPQSTELLSSSRSTFWKRLGHWFFG